MSEYRDIDLKFEKNPITGDVSQLVGVSAVIQDVKEIVLTSSDEYQFNESKKGGGAYKALFDLRDTLSAVQFQTVMKQQILQFCNAVETVDISITTVKDNRNMVDVEFELYVKNSPEAVKLTLPLEITK